MRSEAGPDYSDEDDDDDFYDRFMGGDEDEAKLDP